MQEANVVPAQVNKNLKSSYVNRNTKHSHIGGSQKSYYRQMLPSEKREIACFSLAHKIIYYFHHDGEQHAE